MNDGYFLLKVAANTVQLVGEITLVFFIVDS